MVNILQRQLTQLPARPGVYELFNAAGKLLYVGKAKNLRSRVRSYFQAGAELSPAKQVMVQEVHHLQTTTVKNEPEALLLEGSLIKQHQPPYNVVLKDDKSWLYFAIDYRQPYPRIFLERRPTTRGVKYFGPYPAASTARDSLKFLKKILGLRTCTNPADKPCFESNFNRCLGHNLGPGSKARYRRQLKYFEQALRGQTKELVASLETAMAEAANQKRFEVAARLRDQKRALERLSVKQNVISPRPESYDVLGLGRTVGLAAVTRLPIRRGVLLDAEHFLLNHTAQLTKSEILNGFIEQYYPQVTERVKTIYLATISRDTKLPGTKLIAPERGQKRSLLRMAESGALNYLDQSAASWQRRTARAEAGLKELQYILKLPQPPRRIEGYDISNIQGVSAVGAMVVLTKGLPDPKQYRKFNITGLKGPNDFAMLAQVLTRRFTHNQDWPTPDLVMLDGGAGQLSTVKRALDQARVTIPLIALAKREELIYVPGRALPIKLPNDSSARLLLQELRDEAHRFGIIFYRSRHRKATVRSGWDELPGVGPVLKRKLKLVFGTLAALRQASAAQLDAAVGQKRAQVLREYLR